MQFKHSYTPAPAAGTPAPMATQVEVCRAHYRVAERIHANAAWQSQVINAAAAVGAERVPYVTLVQRAREILLRGATYTIQRGGRYIQLGASLSDEGGYIPLGEATEQNPTESME